jgi:nicotinate phosphoribosyltransferase
MSVEKEKPLNVSEDGKMKYAPCVDLRPTNSLVSPMLTDMYQISMIYAYWDNKKDQQHSVFDLFFRKNPFSGEYCVFAGLDEVLLFMKSFK